MQAEPVYRRQILLLYYAVPVPILPRIEQQVVIRPGSISPISQRQAPGASITSYLWNFGDGTQDTTANPSHRFTTGGSHNVILYVNDNFGCQGKAQVKNAQKAIVLTGGIFPNFNPNVASSCNLPVTANFTNTTSGVSPRTYNWDFGDGGGFT